MILRSLAVGLISLVAIANPAVGDDDPDVHGGTTSGGIFVNGSKAAPPPRSPGDMSTAHHGPGASAPQIVLGESACAGATKLLNASAGAAFCPGAEPAPALTIGAIRRAFAELPLPAGELVIQPPDGLTLVNFDTNFYTTSTEPITSTATLLGQQVTLEATPAEYQWDFGDGDALTTTEPGAAYPALRITHSYLSTGTYQPNLDTTYTGRYRVGGGPWLQIPGTVTIDGTGQDLRAIEAQPKLVGY